MFRFTRAFATIVAALALVLAMAPMAPTVSAHAADGDGSGVCYGSVKIVVFDLVNQAGADDDFCFYPYYNLAQDPNFSSNDPTSTYVPEDDIGNRYLMNNFTSSVSIRNDTTDRWLCVVFYPDINFGSGWRSWEIYAPPGSHIHQNFFGGLGDNDAESMKVLLYTTNHGCP